MMKKTIAMLLVIVFSLFVISACQVVTEGSGAGVASDDANSVPEIPEHWDNASNLINTTDYTSVSEETLATINEKLDAILSGDNDGLTEFELAEKYPDEFSAIVDLGEEAIPALNDIIYRESNPNPDLRTQLAYYALYTIKPDKFDISYMSPSGKYALKGDVESFADADTILGITYKMQIVDNNDSIIFESDDDYYFNDAFWSPDGRYVAISNGLDYWTNLAVIDAEDQKLVDLVNLSDIAEIFSDEYTIDGNATENYYFEFDEWVDDNTIKVEIELDNSSNEPEYKGWYIYDLANEEIEEIELINVLED